MPGQVEVRATKPQHLVEHGIEMHPDGVGRIWGQEAAEEYSQIRRATSINEVID
ncbi:MAG: hypothetical protein NUV69_02345 [Candidatus Curtissbacteria bacterium]|nr:hypothetical protein [Candidatus Curtissbacteria bacterium]